MRHPICNASGFCVLLVGFLIYGIQSACFFMSVYENVSPTEHIFYKDYMLPKNHQNVGNSSSLIFFDESVCSNVPFLNICLSMVVCISLFLSIHYWAMRIISKLVAMGWILECIFVVLFQTSCIIGSNIRIKPITTDLEKGITLFGEACKQPTIYHVHLAIATFILMAMFYKFSVLRSNSKLNSAIL